MTLRLCGLLKFVYSNAVALEHVVDEILAAVYNRVCIV